MSTIFNYAECLNFNNVTVKHLGQEEGSNFLSVYEVQK